MGELTLPASGTVYLDTSAVIYAVEKIEPYASMLTPLWLKARAGEIGFVASNLLLLECLVQPVRDKDAKLQKTYRELLTSTNEFRLRSITMDVIESALQLRATHGLRTPDALHAATALQMGCAQFITNDVVFRRVPNLNAIVLLEHADE